MFTRVSDFWKKRVSDFWKKIIVLALFTSCLEAAGFTLLKLIGYLDHLQRVEKASIAHLIFLPAFWLTYFFGEQLKIGRLRSYLDRYTYRKDPVEGDTLDCQLEKRKNAMSSKITSSITSQGVFIAIISLILNLLYRVPVQERSIQYQKLLKESLIVVGFATIILMLWAIELLDTAQNAYKDRECHENSEPDKKYPLERMIYFYRELGIGGGISYRFYGFALLSVFFICSFAFIIPSLTGGLVILFACVGYPVVFGYEIMYNSQAQIESVRAVVPYRTFYFLTFLAISAWIISSF